MDRGIIYIARNDSDPISHHKIGKTTRFNPNDRMKELNSVEVNYRGQYYIKGYVVVDDVHNCETIIHNFFKDQRINHNREFFEVEIENLICCIKDVLSEKIIEDHLPEMQDGTLHWFELILNLEELNFLEVCKIANRKSLVGEHQWDGMFHGIPASPLFYFFYILINKKKIIQKIKETQHLSPQKLNQLKNDFLSPSLESFRKKNNVHEEITNFTDFLVGAKPSYGAGDYFSFYETYPNDQIEEEKQEKHNILQDYVINTDFKTYFAEIPYPRNLLYLGTVIYFLEHCFNCDNKLIWNCIIKNVQEIFSHHSEISEVIKRVKESLKAANSKGYILSYANLHILTLLFE